ncbi:MAG TPA: class II fructose-bisphosphate aldolase [Bryobacteraceae bacterium]|nr:class II fructose-bisphosphate aldolase [Bryobacteraceae bacterium]
MKTLYQCLGDAEKRGAAVGHFNISDLVGLKAVYQAAKEQAVPVLVGVSEGESDFIGARQAAALVRSLRDSDGIAIYLNSDHTHSRERARAAALAGFDMVVFDASAKPIEENLRETRKVVQELKNIRPDVLVEGEIGFIGSSSSIHDEIPANMSPMTTPEEARQFVRETGVDILAPAVGNMHGMLKQMVLGKSEKHIDPARIAAIKGAAGTFLTLHGGSGTNRTNLVQAIQAGITIIHINTELRVAWRRGLDQVMKQKPDEIVPYKLLPPVVDSVRNVVSDRLQLFNTKPASASA